MMGRLTHWYKLIEYLLQGRLHELRNITVQRIDDERSGKIVARRGIDLTAIETIADPEESGYKYFVILELNDNLGTKKKVLNTDRLFPIKKGFIFGFKYAIVSKICCICGYFGVIL